MKSFSLILYFLLLLLSSTYANMAQPFVEGSWNSSPFLHEHVDILYEKINISFEKDQGPANFQIVYHIHVRDSGIAIPFLFYAAYYEEGFQIKLDGKELNLLEVPEAFKVLDGAPFQGFDYFFEIEDREDYEAWEVEIEQPEQPSSSLRLDIRELKYFQADLVPGKHIIKLEYQAFPGTSYLDWVKKRKYRYALAPARYWRSFGELEIRIDSRNLGVGELISNLGKPDSGSLGEIASWRFTQIPADWMLLDFEPEISLFARIMIGIGPFGISTVLAFALILLHIYGIKSYWSKLPKKNISPVFIFGSIIIPLAILFVLVLSYEFIDWAIGPEAGRMHHAYSYIFIFAYPFLLPVYAIPMYFCDRYWKKRFRKNTSIS